jgi:hypothetical protein
LTERLDRIEKILKQQADDRLADREGRPVTELLTQTPGSFETDNQAANIEPAEWRHTTT